MFLMRVVETLSRERFGVASYDFAVQNRVGSDLFFPLRRGNIDPLGRVGHMLSADPTNVVSNRGGQVLDLGLANLTRRKSRFEFHVVMAVIRKLGGNLGFLNR